MPKVLVSALFVCLAFPINTTYASRGKLGGRIFGKRVDKLTQKRRPARTAKTLRGWLSRKRRGLLSKGADRRHLPKLRWQGKRGERSPRAFVLVHGIGESAHGLAELSRRYSKHGNVLVITLRGHGINSDHLRGVSRRDWYQDVNEAVLYAKNHLGQKVSLVGFSLGGVLAISHQLRALEHGDTARLVDSLALHSPVLLKDRGTKHPFSTYIKDASARLQKWQAANPNRNPKDYAGYYVGKNTEYTMKVPVPLLDELFGITEDSRAFLDLTRNNSALKKFVEAKTKMAIFMSSRDVKVDVEGTMEYLNLIGELGGKTLAYITNAKMRHEDTVRSSPSKLKIKVDRTLGRKQTDIKTTRKGVLGYFVYDFVKFASGDETTP